MIPARILAAAAIAALVLLAVSACGGGGSRDSTATRPAFNPDQEQGTSTCGFTRAKVELDGVTCEIVEAMVALLDGRSMRQTLTVSAEGKKATWVCTSPTRSVYAPLHCAGPGSRSFTLKFKPS